jgi:hypothetical protein
MFLDRIEHLAYGTDIRRPVAEGYLDVGFP